MFKLHTKDMVAIPQAGTLLTQPLYVSDEASLFEFLHSCLSLSAQ